MAFAEDLTLFFDTDDFAIEVTFTITGGTITTNAIFNDGTALSGLYESAIETGVPYLLCQTAEITDLHQAATVTISGDTYTVERIERIDDGALSNVYLVK